MNTRLRAVEQWMYDNRLTVNVDKTHFMLLSRRPLQLDVGCDVLLNGVKLKRVTEVRFLGVVLRDNLSFAGHIKCVANKVSK